MLRRTFLPVLVGSAAILLSTAGGVSADTLRQTTLRYDDSQAAEFKSDVAAGVQVWNSSVRNVRLVKSSGGGAEIRIIADNGWPRAELGPVRPGGRVTVWYGRQAVQQGYDRTRIIAHELGHSLGLDDNKPGPCSSLMSGSTGGVDCKNATPNAAEKGEVESNYSGLLSRPASGRVLVDAR